MNAYALLSLASCMVVVLVGSFTYLRGTRRSLNRVFALLCAFVALWSLAEYGYRQAADLETAYFWLKLSDLSFLVAPLLLHFVLIFTNERALLRRRLTYVLIYAPAFAVILLSLLTNTIGGEPARQYWGWAYTIPENSLIYNISYFWGYGLGILALYLCLLYYLKQADHTVRQQAKYVFIGFCTPLAAGLVTEWLLPLLQVKVPELTTIAFTISCLCATYAMWRYQLFAVTPATAAEGIISTMPDALLVTDPLGTIVLINPAASKMLGYGEGELAGMSLGNVFAETGDGKALVGESMPEDGDVPQTQCEDTVFRGKDGMEIPVSLSSSPMRDGSGKVQGAICIARDITEQRNAEQQKRSLQEQLEIASRLASVGQLAAGVAHEINNPLAAVQGFAQFLAQKDSLDQTVKRDVETIYREAQRATKITGDLLSFAGSRMTEKQLVSLNEILENSMELHSYSAKLRNIEIRKDLDPALPGTMADVRQMQQVFLNIAGNAEQAMAEAHGRGRLSVKTERAGNRIRITFQDDGPGIERDHLKKVFDPFFTTRDVGKGAGLGLSICFGIVREHGGTLSVESRPGEGATFVIELPIMSEEQAQAASVARNAGRPE